MTRLLIAGVFSFAMGLVARTQDIRAASYEVIGLGGIECLNRLRLYVETDQDAGRDSVLVFFGSGYGWLPLVSSESLGEGSITKHTFQRSYPYPGPGSYQLDAVIDSRIAGITNLPNSEETESRLQPWFILTPQLVNSSPVVSDLSAPIAPIASGAVYSPGVEDVDGDSLVFSLVPCNGEGYFIPEGTTIDPQTGELTCEPAAPGLYAFCTRIDEFRDGQVIASTFTDMVMEVDHAAGAPEAQLINGVGLFPNAISRGAPTSVRTRGPMRLEVLDGRGRLVLSSTVRDSDLIDLELQSGTYVYQLTGTKDGAVFRGRLVVF